MQDDSTKPTHDQDSSASPQSGNGGQPGKGSDPESLGTLFAKLSEHGSTLFRNEVELVKIEAKEKATKSAISIGLFVVAGVIAYFALAVLIATAILGLANAIPAWLAALVIGVVLILLAGGLVFAGVRIMKKKSGRPSVGVRVKKDLAALGLSSPEEQTESADGKDQS